MSSILSVSDVMKEAEGRFRKMAQETEAFCAKMRQELAQIMPESCLEHEDVTLEIDEEKTIGSSWLPKKLVVCYKPCPKCSKQFDDLLVNERFHKMGIAEKVIHATFENFDAKSDSQKKALAKVQRQLKIGSGFITLRGTPGAGKTHLAAATLKTKGGLFVTMADLIAELRQTYVDHTGSDDMVSKYRSAEILVLDELTLEVKGVDIPALLYRILGDRYDKGKLTIITSNETLESIVSILGARLTDRMKANQTIVTCEWDSYRSKKQ